MPRAASHSKASIRRTADGRGPTGDRWRHRGRFARFGVRWLDTAFLRRPSAADLGCYELGAPLPHYGPRPRKK